MRKNNLNGEGRIYALKRRSNFYKLDSWEPIDEYKREKYS